MHHAQAMITFMTQHKDIIPSLTLLAGEAQQHNQQHWQMPVACGT